MIPSMQACLDFCVEIGLIGIYWEFNFDSALLLTSWTANPFYNNAFLYSLRKMSI